MNEAKRRYEHQVLEATTLMIEILFANKDEENRVVMTGKELYDKVYEQKKISRHAMNEASGRLKAVGFHRGVQRFRVDEAKKRKDGKKYYYQIDPQRHPALLSEEEVKKCLLARAKRLERERQWNTLLF